MAVSAQRKKLREQLARVDALNSGFEEAKKNPIVQNGRLTYRPQNQGGGTPALTNPSPAPDANALAPLPGSIGGRQRGAAAGNSYANGNEVWQNDGAGGFNIVPAGGQQQQAGPGDPALDEYIKANPAATRPGYVPGGGAAPSAPAGNGGGQTAAPATPTAGSLGLTEDQFAMIADNPDALAAISSPQVDPAVTDPNATAPTVVDGQPQNEMVPVMGEDGRVAYTNNQNAANSMNADYAAEIAANEEAQDRFLRSEEGQNALARMTRANTQAVQVGRSPGGQGGGGLGPAAVPDRGPNELSMADATALAQGDRRKARAMVVESRLRSEQQRQGGQQGAGGGGAATGRGGQAVQDDPSFAPPDPEAVALAQNFGYELPQNAAQAALVRLNIQEDQLKGFQSRRDQAAEQMAQAENELTGAAYDQVNLDEVDSTLSKRWGEFKESNPNASRGEWLRSQVQNGTPMAGAAQQAMQQGQANYSLMLEEGVHPAAQALNFAGQQFRRYDQIGSEFAMERGLALQPYSGQQQQSSQTSPPQANQASGDNVAIFEEEVLGQQSQGQQQQGSQSNQEADLPGLQAEPQVQYNFSEDLAAEVYDLIGGNSTNSEEEAMRIILGEPGYPDSVRDEARRILDRRRQALGGRGQALTPHTTQYNQNSGQPSIL